MVIILLFRLPICAGMVVLVIYMGSAHTSDFISFKAFEICEKDCHWLSAFCFIVVFYQSRNIPYIFFREFFKYLAIIRLFLNFSFLLISLNFLIDKLPDDLLGLILLNLLLTFFSFFDVKNWMYYCSFSNSLNDFLKLHFIWQITSWIPFVCRKFSLPVSWRRCFLLIGIALKWTLWNAVFFTHFDIIYCIVSSVSCFLLFSMLALVFVVLSRGFQLHLIGFSSSSMICFNSSSEGG